MFDGALRDVRYAVRILAKTPGFLAAAVLSVALGIGASTTMFSSFAAVFLRPLPYRDADRLVKVTKTGGDHRDRQVTVGDVLFWREHARSFQSLGARRPRARRPASAWAVSATTPSRSWLG